MLIPSNQPVQNSSPSANVGGQSQLPPELGPIAGRIARQLALHLDRHRPSGDAFVVSIYGEWGVGKTFCLKQLYNHFAHGIEAGIDAALDRRETTRLVVPVLFDPWRYEHEEHLVVSLLKTIEYELRSIKPKIEAALKRQPPAIAAREIATAMLSKVGEAIATFADVAVALACGFKFKFAPLEALFGAELEIAPKDAVEMFDKRGEKSKAAAPVVADTPGPLAALGRAAASHEALYFESNATLEKLTEDESPLRLVILIDDLDRCLPEKAVQVLESVKLFLNVQGFSFVLAVDDEVVERGIAHRYRDYRPSEQDRRAGAAPVTGAEYLEKIVHLPIHLPRWTTAEAAAFLTSAYPALFAPPQSAPNATDPQAQANKADGRRAVASPAIGEAALLLRLATGGAIPLVPRKLIRLAEALAFQHQHFAQIGAVSRWDALHAARLIALQQLYPALYRHVRARPARYLRMFTIARDAFGDPIESGDSLRALELRLEARGKKDDTTADPPAGERTETVRERHDLMSIVQQASFSRGAPDPLLLFAPIEGLSGEGWRSLAFIASPTPLEVFDSLYIHGLNPASAAPATAVAHALEPATLQNPAAFIAALLDPDAIARQEAIESSNAVGKRLPDDAFATLLRRSAESIDPPLLGDLAWLRDIERVTSPEQFLHLYNQGDVLSKVLARTVQQ